MSEWEIPCPHCNTWWVMDYLLHVKEGVLYCPHCGVAVSDEERYTALDKGRFTNDEGPNRSYHLSRLHSKMNSLASIVNAQHDPNISDSDFSINVLGRPWADIVTVPPKVEDLLPLVNNVPLSRITHRTLAVDVQHDRIEACHVDWDDETPRFHRIERFYYRGTDRDDHWLRFKMMMDSLRPDMTVVDCAYEKGEVLRALRRNFPLESQVGTLWAVWGIGRPSHEDAYIVTKQPNREPPIASIASDALKSRLAMYFRDKNCSIADNLRNDTLEQLTTEILTKTVRGKLHWEQEDLREKPHEAWDLFYMNIAAKRLLPDASKREFNKSLAAALNIKPRSRGENEQEREVE